MEKGEIKEKEKTDKERKKFETKTLESNKETHFAVRLISNGCIEVCMYNAL